MIQLGYPCPENVASMPKTGCGNYCTTCTKNIVDFREKTNEEVKTFLSENKSVTCGIFAPEHVQNPVKNEVSSMFRIAFAAVFVFGFNVNVLFGQDRCKIQVQDGVRVEFVKQSDITIVGKILQFGQAIGSAEVSLDLDGEHFSFRCDETGVFLLKNFNHLRGKTVDLYFSAPGVETQFVSLENIESGLYKIEADLGEREYIRGEIAMPGMIIQD